MNILVIPTTDWVRHPVPSRLNFIFDHLSTRHNVYVLHFQLSQFKNSPPRETNCTLIPADKYYPAGLISHYLLNYSTHRRKIKQIVKEKKIDVILSANVLPSYNAEYSGARVVFDYLDVFEEAATAYYPLPFVSSVVKGIVNHNLHGATKIITVTQELKEYLIGAGFRRNISVIPNGVDTGIMKPLSKDEAKSKLNLSGPVIGYVGSLEPWVDLELVIKALWFTKCSLLVVGPRLFTDYEDKLRDLTKEENVEDRVSFVGAIPYADLPKYISAMDIGLNPLKNTTHNKYSAGSKVFNYLACGVPVLSSDVPSLRALLGDEISYYNGGDEFVYKVQEMLRADLNGDWLRSFAMEYDWKVLAGKYEKVLESAV